jgi:hypothetical protein
MSERKRRKSGKNRYYPPVPFIVYDLDEYELSKSAKDEIFSRRVRPITNRSNSEYKNNKFALTGGHDNFLDTEHTYHMNSLGYRSDEFSTGVDFVYAGCSYSFGEGSAEKDIWGSKVAEHFGYSYSNLSRPGASVQWIVKNLFNYFREYGHPKVLACLFPDFCRIAVPVNPHISTVKGEDSEESWTAVRDIHLGGYVELADRPKYSKKPHALEDVLPVELPMELSIEYISMLARYCETNNIKFYWATWDISASIFMRDAAKEYGYPEYLDLKNEEWHDFSSDDYRQYFHKDASIETIINECYAEKCVPTDCHQEERINHGKYFYIGSDVEYVGGPSAHFGVHRHTHTAESFIEALNGLC